MITDDYGNLTLLGVADYLKEKNFFSKEAKLRVVDLHAVKESIDGYVNLIFHVTGPENKSMILKQVLSFPRYCIEEEKSTGNKRDWTLDLGRMRFEISSLIFWNAVSPRICPEIHLFDEKNRIIVMEDLIKLSLLRYDLCRMVKNFEFPKKIGEFFARNLFFSSNLHLTKYKKTELEAFFKNPEYKALSTIVFEDENVAVSWTREMVHGCENLRRELIENLEIQAEIKRLQHKFLTQKECLIHTDLHSSNIMLSQDDVRIIDGEFAGFGPLAQDFGRLSASLTLNYISWFADDEKTAQEKADFQNYLLASLKDLYQSFQTVFKSLVAKHAKENYALKNLDLTAYFCEQLHDALSYTGINLSSRLAYRGMCYDLERLPEKNRLLPSLLGLKITKELLLYHKNYQSIDDYIAYLKKIAF